MGCNPATVDDLAAVLLTARHGSLLEWRWDRVSPAKRTEAREQAEAALRWFADRKALGLDEEGI
jgi:hypothetical protein